MRWIGTSVLVVAAAGAVALAVGQEEEPRYAGDMPSMFAEQPPLPPLAAPAPAAPAPAPASAPAQAASERPRAEAPPAPAPVGVTEVSGQRATYGDGFRGDPGTGPDTTRSYQPPFIPDDPDNPCDNIPGFDRDGPVPPLLLEPECFPSAATP